MKIGISCYPTVGGSGAVATELGKALAHKGHEVHFIVTDVPFRLGEFHKNIYVHELDTSTYPVLRTPPYDFSLAALMSDVVKEHDLDILHVHYALPFAVCAFLAKSMLGSHRVKTVTTLHGTDVTVLTQDKRLLDIMRLGIEQSDAVTAVSDSLVAQTKELFSIERNIARIHNFIDTDVFKPDPHSVHRHCYSKQDEPLLLHISNFRPVKRVLDVIQVFARVYKEVPSRLLMVGEGPDSASARELVRSLGLEDAVLFLGKQDEVAALFATADILLLPSQKESFGLVALEAMASGMPVIGTSIGGIPEVVRHGIDGYLFDIGDVEGMSHAVLRLLRDPHLFAEISQNARQRAELSFHLHEKVMAYEALYDQVMAQGRI